MTLNYETETPELADRLRQARRANGISAQRLSELTQGRISRAVIANIETSRKTDVTVTELLMLSSALNVAPAQLVPELNMDPRNTREVIDLLTETRACIFRAMDELRKMP